MPSEYVTGTLHQPHRERLTHCWQLVATAQCCALALEIASAARDRRSKARIFVLFVMLDLAVRINFSFLSWHEIEKEEL